MFTLARSRARRQRFQQSRSLSVNKTLEDQEPVPAVTAKRGSFKHFAQSLARFQSLRARRLNDPTNPTLGPLAAGSVGGGGAVAGAPGGLERRPSQPPFRLYSTSSRDESKEVVTVFGYPAAYVQLALLAAMVTITCLILIIYPSPPGMRYLRPRSSQDGHWRPPQADTLSQFGSERCTLDRKYLPEVDDDDIFNARFRFRRPVVVTFESGSAEWARRGSMGPEAWTRPELLANHGAVLVHAGRSDDLVRRSVSANRHMTLETFITKFVDASDDFDEPLFVYDWEFLQASGLDNHLNVPSFLSIKKDSYDLVMSLGGPRAGIAFHHQGDAWMGLVHGAARVFLYPHDHTPPGGASGDFSVLQWFNLVYPHLEESRRPLECVLDAGDILYIPEGMYTQVLLLADTVIVGATSKQAHTEEQLLLHKAALNKEQLSPNMPGSEQQEIWYRDNVRIFLELLFNLPDNAEVQMLLGDAYLRVGELGDAERHTRHATFMDAQFVSAFINLALIHNQLGNIAEADRNFQTALKLNPQGARSYSQFTEFLISHGKTAEAETILRQGAILRPDLSQLWTHLAQLIANYRTRGDYSIKDEGSLQGG